MKLTLSILFSIFLSSAAFAENIPEAFFGSFAGLGYNSAKGDVIAVFHLSKVQGKTYGSIQFSNICGYLGNTRGVYFEEISYEAATDSVSMFLKFQALRELGVIVNEVVITRNEDGTLSGEYKTNSMTNSGDLLWGEFHVSKGSAKDVEFTPAEGVDCLLTQHSK